VRFEKIAAIEQLDALDEMSVDFGRRVRNQVVHGLPRTLN
jgi:hypothetical protein